MLPPDLYNHHSESELHASIFSLWYWIGLGLFNYLLLFFTIATGLLFCLYLPYKFFFSSFYNVIYCLLALCRPSRSPPGSERKVRTPVSHSALLTFIIGRSGWRCSERFQFKPFSVLGLSGVRWHMKKWNQ